MKAKDLVVGTEYMDAVMNKRVIYVGVITTGSMFVGQHDFDSLEKGYPGSICTDVEVAKFIAPVEDN